MWETGEGHVVAQQDDSACGACHVPEGEQEDVRWLVSGLLTGASFQVLYRDAGIPGGASTSSALEVVFE